MQVVFWNQKTANNTFKNKNHKFKNHKFKITKLKNILKGKYMKDLIISHAQDELRKLEKLEAELTQRSKEHPEGKLNIMVKRQRYPQFFFVDKISNTKGTGKRYIRKENMYLAEKLAQRDYETELLSNTRRRISVLKNLLSEYYATSAKDILLHFHPAKQKLVKPIYGSDEDFISNWYLANPSCLNPYPIKAEYDTNRHETVRSKSEKIIADALLVHNIPYVYESQIRLKNNRLIYPDFKVLNVGLRKEFIWEHFGYMGDPNYSADMVNKLDSYYELGFWPGENLLFTCESSENHLNTNQVNSIIQKYLL